MVERIIIHLDMDCFFAQVEERESPQFKRKPVVVGADPKGGRGRGVVSTCNYEARKFGVHSAMPISQAWKLCPDAVFLPPNFELYSRVSENIMNIIRGFAEQVEQVSLDEAYIEINPKSDHSTSLRSPRAGSRGEVRNSKQTWEKAEKLAQQMRKEILQKEKLKCSCGIGPNKMVAKIACEAAKPPRQGSGQANGVVVVREEEAEKFMEPLDIEKMPGIGQKTAAILRQSNFNTVADLKKLSEHDLEDLFGKRGSEMYLRVRGIDNNSVEPEHEVKSVGKETTFEQDTRDPELLIRTFEQLAKQVAQELAKEGLAFKTITVVCRFSGFETHTKDKTLKEPSSSEAVLREEAIKLFLRFLTENQKPIRLLGVRAKIAPKSNI
ncbi:MAG TPA: DNA polymerase IV [Candidatus Paceibacterota bacterium]